eukprot:gene1500-biopygen4606
MVRMRKPLRLCAPLYAPVCVCVPLSTPFSAPLSASLCTSAPTSAPPSGLAHRNDPPPQRREWGGRRTHLPDPTIQQKGE